MSKTHITHDDVTESGVFRFVTDASELGWPPGHVPDTLTTDIGNQLPFVLVKAGPQGFEYRQQLGCATLMVFND